MFDTLSLEQMRAYLGREAVPDDFDHFWQEQLNAVPTIPEYTLTWKPFNIANCDCYELWFKGHHEGEVFAKIVKPNNVPCVPVLFYFHGYQGASPDWSQMLNYVAVGFAVVCLDVRGQSGRSIDYSRHRGNTVKGHIIRGVQEGREQLLFKDVFLDLYQLINIVDAFDWSDSSRLMTYGASQGGALAIVAAALNEKISKVVSIYPFLSDYKRILELGDMQEAYSELFRYFKYYDPYHETERQLLETLSYIDVKNFAHRVKASVQMHISMQDSVCPPSTQFAIYNRIQSEKIYYVLQEYGHDALNILVNDVVFNFLANTQIETSKF